MLQFKKLDDEILQLKKYFDLSPFKFCDLSVGVRYLWKDAFSINYCLIDDTLIMRESVEGEEDAFYFPIGNNIEKALLEIEKYCLERFIPLRFCCIDDSQIEYLNSRYANISVTKNRDWCDYIYPVENFKSYSGRKLSGQRNHVNKFKKTYPEYVFRKITEKDIPKIKSFLNELEESVSCSSWTERQERKNLIAYTENTFALGQFGGIIEVNGKIIALSIGEKVGDTLIVHIEKGNKNYDGVYPTVAQEFVRAFADEEIKFVNREEDCGDTGLRTSKLQYHPCEIKTKNLVTVKTLIEKINSPVNISTERLTISEISESDKDLYARLYTDDDLNKYWGYDYKDDLGNEKPTPDYFFSFQKQLKDKGEEHSFAVKKDGKMIGELVLHNFDFYGGVEMGFRFFAEYQGKGYAAESALAMKYYVSENLKPSVFKSRCDKRNLPSRRLIERLGLKLYAQDDTHYYFSIKY